MGKMQVLLPDPGTSFDFDTWAALAKRDVAAFERCRRELIERFIAQAPPHMQLRLRRLQWRIDAERRRYKHPLKSCLALHAMMWESLYGKGGLIQVITALKAGYTMSQQSVARSAIILPFHR